MHCVFTDSCKKSVISYRGWRAPRARQNGLWPWSLHWKAEQRTVGAKDFKTSLNSLRSPRCWGAWLVSWIMALPVCLYLLPHTVSGVPVAATLSNTFFSWLPLVFSPRALSCLSSCMRLFCKSKVFSVGKALSQGQEETHGCAVAIYRVTVPP